MILSRMGGYPARPTSGVQLNYGHPITKKLQLATVCSGPYAYDLVRGTSATLQGNPTRGFAAWGSGLECDGTGDALEWAGHRTVMTDLDITLGGLFRFDIVNRNCLATSNTTNAGFRLDLGGGSGTLRLTKGGVIAIDSGISSGANSLLLVASYRASDGVINFVSRNVVTNVIETATVTNTSAPLNGDGIFSVGGARVFPTAVLDGNVGLAIISFQHHPLSTLVQWANDPYAMFLSQSPSVKYFLAAAVTPPDLVGSFSLTQSGGMIGRRYI
mgnify:CR=1 FL=1